MALPGICLYCKHWFPNVYPDIERDKFEGCCSSDMDNDGGGYIEAGGEDGYGDYFRTSSKFGCIFFEEKGV